MAAPSLCGLSAIACAALLALTACHKPGASLPGISTKQEITPQPVRVGTAWVALQLADAAGKPVSHAAISVEADMSHPGMSPVFGNAQEIAPGSYQAPIDFNMAGDWVVLLHIRLADGRRMERQMDVRSVQSN